MPLPLLAAALAPLLFRAERKWKAEPGRSTIGECHRVQHIQFADAAKRAQGTDRYGDILIPFYDRLIEKRAGGAAVEHSPHFTYMLMAEIEAITIVIDLIEALDEETPASEVQYLPIPTRPVVGERPPVL